MDTILEKLGLELDSNIDKLPVEFSSIENLLKT